MKNAKSGTDAGGRNLAVGVCERHFTRDSKPWENYGMAVKTTVVQMPDYQDGMKMVPKYKFDVQNNATDIVIKHLDITVTSETGTDTSQSGTWGFNMNVEPGEQATFYGILANTTQPTVVNVVTTAKVLPHTGT